MIRRRFITFSAVAAAAVSSQRALPRAPWLVVDPDVALASVPENFIGLSYEVQQLADPSFFSSRNRGLIEQFRALATKGVLRLGGNTSDVGWWKPSADSIRPEGTLRAGLGAAPRVDLGYAIEPEAIRQLRSFLDATGWTCVFGINLASNTAALAVDQARHVVHELGPTLEYLQLGNEPDLYAGRLRDARTWGAEAYLVEWLPMVNAIAAAVPAARFGLPDSVDPRWCEVIATRLTALAAGGHALPIAAFSHHYYFGGPPANPEVNIGRLLGTDPRVRQRALTIRAAAARFGVPWRMTEGNTCFLGGKPGVSDVFASALWSADYLLTLASLGYAGVNLHGGGGREVANSLGGTLPGELLMKDPQVPHPRPFYTPIAAMDGQYRAQPVNAGMRLAAAFAGATMLRVHFDPGPVNASAFAARTRDGRTLLVIVNKDAEQDLLLDLSRWALVSRLRAPSLLDRAASLSAPADDAEARTAPQSGVPKASAILLEQATPAAGRGRAARGVSAPAAARPSGTRA